MTTTTRAIPGVRTLRKEASDRQIPGAHRLSRDELVTILGYTNDNGNGASAPAGGSLFAPDQVYEITLTHLHPHPDNLRSDLGDLTDLAASIASVGILEPLLVEPHPTRTGHYQVIAGHRRRAGAITAKIMTAPCIIREGLDPADHALMMLIENLQREGLTPLDEARGFAQLRTANWTQAEIADRVGCNQSHVSKRLSLLTLPAKAHTALADGAITVEDALALTKIADTPTLVEQIVTDTAKKHRSGHYAAGIAQQVAKAQADAKVAAQADTLREKLTKRGVTILDKAPTKSRRLGPYDLDLDTKAHQNEPCHAVTISTYYDHADTVDYCTDPARHAPKGTSPLKTTTKRETAERKMSAAERAARDAADNRRLFARRLFDPDITTNPVGLLGNAYTELIERRYLADAASDECSRIAKLLALEPIETEGYGGTITKDWPATIAAYADRGTPERRRACLAFAIIQGETGYIPGRAAGMTSDEQHLQLLVSLGYEPTPHEKKTLPKATTPLPDIPDPEPELLDTDTGDIVDTRTGEIIEHAPEVL